MHRAFGLSRKNMNMNQSSRNFVVMERSVGEAHGGRLTMNERRHMTAFL